MLPFMFLKYAKSTSTKHPSLIAILTQPIADKQRLVAAKFCPFQLLSNHYQFLNVDKEPNFKLFGLDLITGQD